MYGNNIFFLYSVCCLIEFFSLVVVLSNQLLICVYTHNKFYCLRRHQACWWWCIFSFSFFFFSFLCLLLFSFHSLYKTEFLWNKHNVKATLFYKCWKVYDCASLRRLLYTGDRCLLIIQMEKTWIMSIFAPFILFSFPLVYAYAHTNIFINQWNLSRLIFIY